jgi:hypothetical protein
MENPNAERQAVLLERILKNMVKYFLYCPNTQLTYPQSKCTETILELNRCIEVSNPSGFSNLCVIDTLKFCISEGDFTRKWDSENCSRLSHQISEECTIQFRGNERKLVLFYWRIFALRCLFKTG